jgi:hypothetical protein
MSSSVYSNARPYQPSRLDLPRYTGSNAETTVRETREAREFQADELETHRMKPMTAIALSLFAFSASAFSQAPDQAAIDKALMAAPGNLKTGATVIKWKPDYTYDTLKKGTNRLVCYDKSGQPGQQPFSVECTNLGNLDRAAQNMKYEAVGDRKASQAALDGLEKDGTRSKPEFGSVWYHLQGADADHTRTHMTIAVPGATAQSLGLPDNNKSGGVWIMNAGTSTAHLMIPGE